MRDARQLIRITALLTALSLGLAACGGDDGEGDSGGDEPKSSASKKADPATWPLTGLPVNGGGSAEQDHPVLVLKLDNTEASAPQLGLSHADLVVEELVEGGITRLAAMYYSDIPGDVGPVRSMRASDIGIVAPVDGAMVTSGGAAQTVERIVDAGIRIFNEGSPGFYRESSRSAPYNLFTDMGKVAKAAEDGKDATPADYLPWGTEGDLPAGKPANTLTADFGSHATNWTFENGSYVNQNSYAADGDEFPADSVLVLRVDVGDAGYTDPAGNPVPETIFEGSGNAFLFHAGKVVEGTWSKDELSSALSLETKDGKLKVPAGRVWIELVPIDAKGGSLTYGK
ncbi:DUF3048 domain-containing protein [Nocardioides bizhenqiangii]|uniref:DUF3048 domain-containing protein n=1 Tax=Nocardioides bizhenqiangii TaxID=3095076 RepID=A0ABZ0ZTS8_9ACTN|nr:DUF3048 domain-containing protein [Nocardioides sp. HM61]WQQ27695.1 DUF3048 domain-containing protein [Nocardioides sp. HM61]